MIWLQKQRFCVFRSHQVHMEDSLKNHQDEFHFGKRLFRQKQEMPKFQMPLQSSKAQMPALLVSAHFPGCGFSAVDGAVFCLLCLDKFGRSRAASPRWVYNSTEERRNWKNADFQDFAKNIPNRPNLIKSPRHQTSRLRGPWVAPAVLRTAQRLRQVPGGRNSMIGGFADFWQIP